jgi:acyl transferase domain-containing protein/acyl-CoA synthetase (AMP-forming)/AMP-acid ligase II/acyl carrier protein
MKMNSLIELLLEAPQPSDLKLTYLRNGDEPGAVMTQAQLLERARGLAGWMTEQGYAGQRAMLVFPPGLEFVEAFMACMMAGVVAVPVAPAPLAGDEHKVRRMLAILGDCQPALVLGVRQTIDKADAFVACYPQFADIDWLALDHFTAHAQYGGFRLVAPRGDALAFLQYTSGSTAMPKGVMLSHRNVVHNLAHFDHGWGHDEHSVMVSWLPHFHDLGLLYGVLFPLYKGIDGVLMPPASIVQSPVRWLRAISDFRGTHSMGPNFVYDQCSARILDEECDGLDLSSWRMALNAAEPIRIETIERFNARFQRYGLRSTTVTGGFGLAESTCRVTAQDWDQPIRSLRLSTAAMQRNLVQPARDGDMVTELISCGPPALDTEVKIVDPATCKESAPGMLGEIWTRSDSVASGYWKRPAESVRTFGAVLADTPDGPAGPAYMRTGDLGFMDQGELFIAGRVKDLIIIRGENYYPQDIEWAAERAHPAFKHSCCAAFAVERNHEERVVVVQELLRHHSQWTYDEMLDALRRTVAATHDLPVEAIVLIRPGTTSKTSSGKIQRSAAKAAYLEGQLQVLAQWDRNSELARLAAATPGAAATPVAQPVQPVPPVQSAQSVQSVPAVHPTQPVQPVHPAPPARPVRAGQPVPPVPPVPPVQEAIESYLREQVAQVAALPPGAVDVTRPFSEYGLGSLDAIRLTGECGKRFNTVLAPTAVYDFPSIRQLAQHMVQDMAQRAPQVAAKPLDDDAVVVVGLACRFPGAPDAQAFWSLLSEGRCATTIRTTTNGAARAGGFIDDVGCFDNDFFTISPREAACLDPQQRITLETGWHALEDAGIKPASLAGSDTGVFIGASAFDYGALQLCEGELDAYSGQGSVLAVIANRIAYQLDLRGPSFVIDTACSSALSALHLAYRSLRSGECSLALAGGVNLLLAREWDSALIQAGMLAPDARIKTFDAAANGYVRAEGCGMVVLKRHADAVRDGDRIYGALLGTAMNQDGRSNGLTAPNGQAQQALLASSLAKAGVAPAELGYIEAHGTGTPLGDPIECNSWRRVMGERATPCYLGSVKANIGHLEAAAGMAGLIKVLLSLHHERIPAQPNFETLNPIIDLGNTLAIARDAQPWKRVPGARRCASVSAFGFSGTNANVIVGDVPQAAPRQGATVAGEGALPLVLSARDPSSLRRLAAQYARHLDKLPAGPWRQALYTSACRRTAQASRFAVVADTPALLAARLQAFAASPVDADAPRAAAAPKIAFVFTGQGIPLKGAGRDLYRQVPAFRAALDQCDAVLQPLLGKRVSELLYGELDATELAQPGMAQPLQFALQYALTSALLQFGVRPHVVMGHSLGEYAAMVSAGALALDDALALVAARGALTQKHALQGAMLAVFADEALVQESIAATGAQVDLAAINGQHHCVVAGTPAAIAQFSDYLTEHGLAEFRKLAVERAYHSALIEPMLPAFAEAAQACRYAAPVLDLISNVTGELWPAGEAPGAAYLLRHLREPVRFSDSLDTLAAAGVTLAIEIGSKPVLCNIGQAHLDDRGPRWAPTLRHNGDDWRAWLDSLAQAFEGGCEVDWTPLFAPGDRQLAWLPPYAFTRRHHWFKQRVPAARASQEAEPAAAQTTASAAAPAAPAPASAPGPVVDQTVAGRLAAIMSRLLHVPLEQIDHDSSLIELGCDSIVLLSFARSVSDQFGVALQAHTIFEHYPSIALVAAFLAGQQGGHAAPGATDPLAQPL